MFLLLLLVLLAVCIVISGDRGQTSPDHLTAWQQGQRDLAHLSTRGTFLIAEQSGHNIQFDCPDLVSQAITSLF
jgi:pimeloyl-ACP methyl ester carboxylesterase